jgi:Protein of unknown function (DUF3105)
VRITQRSRAALLGAAAGLLVAGLALAGCGGGGAGGNGTTTTGGTQSDVEAARFPRDPSVGYGGPAPPVAASVRAAATAAGCTVRGFPFEPVQIQSDGSYHTEGNPTYKVSLPPTSGLHNPVWADWGVYDTALPFKFQVHNLEHGGIIVHLGKDLPDSAREAVIALWRASPPFVIVTPEAFAQFPAKAVVVTSWQRWMVCNPYTPKALAAIRVYRDVYRGTGPEGAGALNSGASADGLPKPAIPDPGA